MTPNKHAAAAERLLALAHDDWVGGGNVRAMYLLAEAQVHATLSLRPPVVGRTSGFVPRSDFMSGKDLNEQLGDDDGGEGFRVRDWYSDDDPGKDLLDGWDDSDPGA